MITFKTTAQLRAENLEDSRAFLKDSTRQLMEALEKGVPLRALTGQIEYVQKSIAQYMEDIRGAG